MPKTESLPNTDGLEIVSVGTLYDGPWDKKYWSSSRGKDRYPYPVGYHALRTHNGVTYKMEIHEGSAGPVFQITSSDGHSFSGQTPDIAWEAFQRKTSRIKLWHTKRFTCKVDGVEFFGFKNTLVQRLLRELLASLDGVSKQCLLSISSGNGSPVKEDDMPFADLSTKSHATGKRSKTSRTVIVNSALKLTDQASSKKFPKKVNVSSLREEYVICNDAQDLLSSVNLNCHEDCPAPATDLLCKSYQSSSDCEDKCSSAKLEKRHLEVPSYLQSTPVKNEIVEQETLGVLRIDKLKSIEVKNINPSVASEHNVDESEIVNDSEVLEDSEVTKNALLYVPDSLDTLKEDTAPLNITSTEEPCKKKVEYGAINTLTCSEAVGESCPEEETNTETDYKSDFNAVAKEVAKSMMKVLLPQSIPRFTYSRKKKRKHNPSEDSFITPRTPHEHDQVLPSADVACPGTKENSDNLVKLGPEELDGNCKFDRQKEDHVQNNGSSPAVQSTDIASDSIRTEPFGPGNSKSCQSSSVNLCKRTYNVPLSESIICRNAGDGSLVQEEASSIVSENKDAESNAATILRKQPYDFLNEKMHGDETSNKLECNAQFIGCYSHPKRISSVVLKLQADTIHVCTSCGLLEENGRDLFLYKLRIKDPCLGRPSFIGHSRIILPFLQDVYGRDVPIERSALQFTPDARGLVMLDIIQVPYCKEQKFPCPCSTCAPIRFEDNAVKIVHLKKGHVSLLVKFKTLYPVNSVLVCEPDCLAALDESGRIYLWFMNSTWSASIEDYVIPSCDFVASRVVELKRIPNSATLLLGNNGYGDFSLWDITARAILSRYSAPASTIIGFLPISSFRWQNRQVYGKTEMECKDELMAAATKCLTAYNGEKTLSLAEGEDIGIWILARTSADSNCQPGFQPINCQNIPGSWRLGLLVKNMVILGTSFPRSAAIGISAGGHGVTGTDEGLAYMWDVETGNNVEILHDFKGVCVSDIATDGSTMSATAVAAENGQVWIYLRDNERKISRSV